jgi:GT2 family glycosyltransferase
MDSSEIVSIVITMYNRSDALLAVLGGLSRQTDRRFEVIVADDGSLEEHRRKVFESDIAKALHVIHIWHPDVGFTASCIRNRGVAVATGRYIIFLDGDCVPELDFVARHKALASNGFFVNGSRVLLSPELTQRALCENEQIFGRSMMYWLKQRGLGHANKLTGLLRLPEGPWRVKRDFSWTGIRSCNMGVWRGDFERVDGFDESFVGWGHEDADFVLRLHHSGIRRINGFCATEVFHLWHRQASRDKESRNAILVEERARTNVTQAALGYSHRRSNGDVLITRVG